MVDRILLNDIEAADAVRMMRTRLNRLAKKGEAPCVVLPDGELRYFADDLREWAEKYRRPKPECEAGDEI